MRHFYVRKHSCIYLHACRKIKKGNGIVYMLYSKIGREIKMLVAKNPVRINISLKPIRGLLRSNWIRNDIKYRDRNLLQLYNICWPKTPIVSNYRLIE